MRSNNSVLIIAYHWPPDASVGTIRSMMLAKRLAAEGWQPIVLTVKEHYYEYHDTGSMNRPPAALTLRARCLPSIRAIYLSIKASISWVIGKESKPLAFTNSNRDKTVPESVMATAKRVLLSLVHTPDDRLGWMPFAIMQGYTAVKRHDVKCMVSIGPPFTAHLIGLMLRKICRVSWVADFRDPWSWNEQKPWHVKSALSQRIDNRLEKMVIHNADKVVCVTLAMTERYRKMYQPSPEDKWLTITNGFDPDEFAKLGKVERSPVFTITYLGGFTYTRSPRTVLRAIGEALREGVFERPNLAVKLIGHCRYAEGCAVEQMIADNGLDSIVELIDPMPRAMALREMLRSHVLLLLANRQPFQVPGKAYEYLATGRPILAVTEEGATADLIKQSGNGVVVDPTDVCGIKEALKQWYHECRTQGMSAGAAGGKAENDYSWTVLGAHYASVLEACVDNSKSSRSSK